MAVAGRRHIHSFMSQNEHSIRHVFLDLAEFIALSSHQSCTVCLSLMKYIMSVLLFQGPKNNERTSGAQEIVLQHIISLQSLFKRSLTLTVVMTCVAGVITHYQQLY